jgi:hypothetical protein
MSCEIGSATAGLIATDVEAAQSIIDHRQALSRLLSQPRSRYDVVCSAPPAPDHHLAIDHEAFGSGQLGPTRQGNRAARTTDKVFVITPDRQLDSMARAQIDDRCRRNWLADRQ